MTLSLILIRQYYCRSKGNFNRSQLQSPAELLYSRKFQGSVPVRIKKLSDKDNIKARFVDRQQPQKHYHDIPGVRELPPLKVGQSVTVLKDNGSWTLALV